MTFHVQRWRLCYVVAAADSNISSTQQIQVCNGAPELLEHGDQLQHMRAPTYIWRSLQYQHRGQSSLEHPTSINKKRVLHASLRANVFADSTEAAFHQLGITPTVANPIARRCRIAADFVLRLAPAAVLSDGRCAHCLIFEQFSPRSLSNAITVTTAWPATVAMHLSAGNKMLWKVLSIDTVALYNTALLL